MAENNKVQIDIVGRDLASKALADVQTGVAGLSGHMQQLTGYAGGLSGAFAGITAILGGGAMFKQMISTTKEVTGEIVKLKNSFGITAEEASVLRVALDDVFLTADDVTGAAARITKQLVKNEEAFKNLGVATRDNNGNFRSTADIMAETNSKLLEFKEGTDRNIEGVKIYGKGWEDARRTLKLTAEAMEEGKKRAAELHLVIGDQGLANMKEYKKAMKDIHDVTESLQVQIGIVMIPLLTELAVKFGDVGTAGVKAFGDIVKLMTTEVPKGQGGSWADEWMLALFGDYYTGSERGKKYQANAIAGVMRQDWINADVIPLGKKGKGGKTSTGGESGKEVDWRKWMAQQYDMGPKQYTGITPYEEPAYKTYQTSVSGANDHFNEMGRSGIVELTKLTATETAKQTDLQINASGVVNQVQTAMAANVLRLNGETYQALKLEHTAHLEELQQQYAAELFLAGDNEESKFLIGEKYRQMRYQSEQQMEMQVEMMKKQSQDRITDMQLSAAQSAIGIVELIGRKNKGAAIAAFALQKVFSIGQIFINGLVGMSKAVATLPFPFGEEYAAVIAGWTKVNMGLVAAASIGEGALRFGGAGMSGGSGGGTYSSPMVTQPVTNTQQQGNITIVLKGIPNGKYIEEELIPGLNAAGSRNVRIEYLN